MSTSESADRTRPAPDGEKIGGIGIEEGVVLVGRNCRSRIGGRFHTRACRSLPEDRVEWSLEKAEDNGLEECRFCSGEWKGGRPPYDRSLYQMLVDADPDTIRGLGRE